MDTILKGMNKMKHLYKVVRTMKERAISKHIQPSNTRLDIETC